MRNIMMLVMRPVAAWRGTTICDAASEADDAAITPETTGHPIALWAMAWRARSAAWMIRHRRTLELALATGAS